MRYLLDTDHLSIFQRQTGESYSNLSMRSDFKSLPIVSFDVSAATAYSDLEPQRIQLAKMDVRVAAIALSNQLILLTRNHRDFGKVAGLMIEDWTVSL